MILFILTYLAGILTIASPCILPVLPFVLSQADRPFRRTGLPMLGGMALAFAAVGSLAAFAGNWAVELNQYGRSFALALIALFGVTLLFPPLATRLSAPFVALGNLLSRKVDRASASSLGLSLLLGMATGLLWTPCAGPVLGLILAGAALKGPGFETLLLLLAYAAGASTALAGVIVFGQHIVAIMKRSFRLGSGVRRALGAGVVAGVLAISLGLDVSLLTRISSAGTVAVEQTLLRLFGLADLVNPAHAATEKAAPLFGATEWLNSEPLTTEGMKGKVILVNFWTYSCINCLRTLPYVRAWAEKYRDKALVVIGVHTPEFAFEKDVANVTRALANLGVTYPVAVDNDFAIWRTFGNRAWPALYFIDANGRLRDQVFGEGRYAESEQLIQQLLSEAKNEPVAGDVVASAGTGPQAAADLGDLLSGETYIGYHQAQNFASPGGVYEDVPRLYQTPPDLRLNNWALAGSWTVGGEYATLNDHAGRITHRFHARDLHLAMGPPRAGHPIRFRVKIDGAAPGADHGSDVDAAGWGTLREDRLYQLVRQSGTIRDRTFEIEFFDAGIRTYAFTFG